MIWSTNVLVHALHQPSGNLFRLALNSIILKFPGKYYYTCKFILIEYPTLKMFKMSRLQILTDRQTDGLTDRQTDRQADSQTDGQTDRQAA